MSSSVAPGASPTRSKLAFGSPTPKTNLFRDSPKGHFWHEQISFSNAESSGLKPSSNNGDEDCVG